MREARNPDTAQGVDEAVDRLLNARQVAAALGVSQATLYRRVNAGLIPKPVQFGGAARWPSSDIRAVIERLKRDRDGRVPELDEAG